MQFNAISTNLLEQFTSGIITDLDELTKELELDPQLLPNLSPSSSSAQLSQFPLRVPRSFVRRMRKGDSNDPLLLQVLPRAIELETVAGYSFDPLEERKYSPVPGVLHKYHGRVLLLLTSNCCINCRFCFRRYMRAQVERWDLALQYIEKNANIKEVILSGGEPLLWGDDQLFWLLSQLANIPHLKRVRIHSRMPILFPQRISENLTKTLISTRLKPIFVIHCNHAQEIDEEVKNAADKLRSADIILLNQSVLLKNVNDRVDVLVDLSEALFAIGVMPYYLHLLDKVAGSAHFCVERENAKDLIAKIAQQISGYLVPKLVYEQSGALSKVCLNN